jgi:hypothetical protein
MIIVTLLRIRSPPNTIIIAFEKKIVRELNTTANRILNESWALVYRTIPAKVLILKKTRVFTTTTSNTDL